MIRRKARLPRPRVRGAASHVPLRKGSFQHVHRTMRPRVSMQTLRLEAGSPAPFLGPQARHAPVPCASGPSVSQARGSSNTVCSVCRGSWPSRKAPSTPLSAGPSGPAGVSAPQKRLPEPLPSSQTVLIAPSSALTHHFITALRAALLLRRRWDLFMRLINGPLPGAGAGWLVGCAAQDRRHERTRQGRAAWGELQRGRALDGGSTEVGLQGRGAARSTGEGGPGRLAPWPHVLSSGLASPSALGALASLRPCLLSELVLREGWCRWRTGGLTPLCPRWHPSLPWSRGAGGPRGWVGGLWLRPPASVWVPAATLGTRAVFSVIPHPCLCEVGLVTVLTPWGAGSLARQDTECQPRAGPRYVLSWPESPRLIVSCPSGWLLKERGPSGLALCPTHLQLTKGAEGQAWGIQTPRGTGPGAPEDRLQCREEAEPLVSVR